MHRRFPVRADRSAVRPLSCAKRSKGATKATVGAVSDDDVLRGDRERCVGFFRLDDGTTHTASVGDRLEGFVSFEKSRAVFRSIVRNHRIEVAPTHDVSVLWIDRVRRPLQFECAAVGGCAQTFVSVELRKFIGETHVGELFHRARREPVTTSFFAREGLLLDDDAIATELRQPIAGSSTGRATTDDENFGAKFVA